MVGANLLMPLLGLAFDDIDFVTLPKGTTARCVRDGCS